jgi:hypothetical protein
VYPLTAARANICLPATRCGGSLCVCMLLVNCPGQQSVEHHNRPAPAVEMTRKGRLRRLDVQLEQQYGPHFRDRDVRLYLIRRQLNQQQPHRRAGFPLDDSFDRPGTFLKLCEAFQRTICGSTSGTAGHILSSCIKPQQHS